MSENVVTIGRSPDSDHVIIDPQNRVSRNHAQIRVQSNGALSIRDVGSKNGTFVNGKKIPSMQWVSITSKDRITLSPDYILLLENVVPRSVTIDDDRTAVLQKPVTPKSSVECKNDMVVFKGQKKTVTFDPDRTTLGDMLQLDETPYRTIGRDETNDMVLNRSTISRNHCRIRMLTPLIIEIEDLNSTNGTFADGKRLEPNRKYIFDSSVQLRLGKDCSLNLQKIFPGLSIVHKKPPVQVPKAALPVNPAQVAAATRAEMKAFNELEVVWKEYQTRQSEIGNAQNTYMMGGSALGSLLSMALVPVVGPLGSLAGIGVGILGRYLGSQKSTELKNDFTYEEAFLQVYACPRCGESFQKKPWITIRDCFKCRVKYR